MKTVSLREVAHARSGEKGPDVNVTVVAYGEPGYRVILEQLTVDAVGRLYDPIVRGGVERYESPRIGALNFVLRDALGGGRSRTLAFEESGKALSSRMLMMTVVVPDDFPERSGMGGLPPARFDGPTEHRGKVVRLGSATGWARDRFEPAVDLVARGAVHYLCFDSMSEVTMSAAQVAMLEEHGTTPYDPYLEARLEPILRSCKAQGIKIITNQGWLDPKAAAEHVLRLGAAQGIEGLRVAAVCGGLLTERIRSMNLAFLETGQPIADCPNEIVSAETYLGARGIVEALDQGADVVITGRVADGCLYLGPLAHEFGWDFDDHHAMARGMVVGHLMECGCQVTGGYFADPGFKDVPDIANLGNPIADVSATSIVISKLDGTGGVVSLETCKEQLLYEVLDPSSYCCPDVVVDFNHVSLRQIAPNQVEVQADAAGRARTPTLKALIGVREGYVAEEMVLFAGPGAIARAELTRQILEARFARVDLRADEIRMDYVGHNSVHRGASPPPGVEPYEVVLRVAVKTASRHEAAKLRREVDPLAVNGPAGTGKWGTSAPGSRVRACVGLHSCLVPRGEVPWTVTIHTSDRASAP
jgi:hypothetical protein